MMDRDGDSQLTVEELLAINQEDFCVKVRPPPRARWRERGGGQPRMADAAALVVQLFLMWVGCLKREGWGMGANAAGPLRVLPQVKFADLFGAGMIGVNLLMTGLVVGVWMCG